MTFRRFCFATIAGLSLAASASSAFAWGATGHRLVSLIGVQSLPPELPAFLRSPSVQWQVGELGREPDRSKGSGQPHDADLDPAHFVDVNDDGTVMGGPALAALPPTRDAYAKALAAVGVDIGKAGYLPYALADGWQQLVKDFGYWRVDTAGERRGRTKAERAWFAADRRLRELILTRDLGYWSHFVGDASQPLHVSIHYNGWGEGPNPNGYTLERIHGPFEGEYVRANVSASAVRAALRSPAVCTGPVMTCMAAYLRDTQAQAEPLYALWKQGGFQAGDPRGRAFATQQIGVGAAMLRDLVTGAWRASAHATVGYPAVRVDDVEAGRTPPPFESMVGLD